MLNRLRNLLAIPHSPVRGTPRVSRLLRNPPPNIEERATLLDGQHIRYTLKRSKRRSIGLRIDDRGLTVSIPLRASEKWLHSVLQDKAQWVVEKLQGWQTRKPEVIVWQNDAMIPYLGELLVLRVTRSLFPASAQHRHGQLWVFVTDDSDARLIEQAVLSWYQQEAQQMFAQRVAEYAPKLQVSPQAVKLSTAKTQWGCCTARGTVRFNVQLIKLPLRLIDYVVVHELAHLREMNHSAAFWQVVESACPGYVKLRNELKSIAL